MKAILLGAGRGIRVSGATTPKCLVEGITGWRVLDWILNALSDGGGADDFVFVGGDAMDEIQGRYPQLRYVHNPNWDQNHVVGSLFAAEVELDEPFYFSYSDIVYRPEVVARLASSNADIAIVVDRQWRSRYEGRDESSLETAEKVATVADELRWIGKELPEGASPAGEFIGLARFSARGAQTLRAVYHALAEVYGNRPFKGRRNLDDGHLTDLLQAIVDQGGRVEVVWVDGAYAELDAPSDLSQFVFGTKAETLERLRPHLTSASIQDGVRVQVAEWLHDPSGVATALAERFSGEALAVRSSALDEDSALASQAGRYHSVLDVESDDVHSIATAVQQVVDSYGDPSGSPKNQVLVQPCLSDVRCSGVMMTRDLDTGADYLVIHYDDESGRTDTVTAGVAALTRTVKMRRDRAAGRPDALLDALAATAVELEEVTGSDALDIEFAQTQDGELHVLQVRPIAAQSGWSHVEAEDEADFEALRGFLRHRFSRWPRVRGRTTVLGQMPDWNPAEMIGPFPRPLARSLYELLITDHTWRLGRSAIGYADPFPHALMVELAGRPYVDVRMSANNLLPAHLDAEIRERVVDAALDRLKSQPELHDKIEFEVIPSSWSFDLSSLLANLVGHGLDRADAAACEEAVAAHTRELLRCGSDVIAGLLQRTQALRADSDFDVEELDDTGLLASIAESLATIVRDGTLPFATLARMAFVGTSILRSLVGVGALRSEELDAFLRSVRTISTEMLEDFDAVRTGKKSREEFLRRFGHLRPGSYDILSQRYDQDPGLYFPPPSDALQPSPQIAPAIEAFQLSDESRAMVDAALARSPLGVDATALLDFAAAAIRAREAAKFEFTHRSSEVLELLAEFGTRHGLSREDMAMLDVKELLELCDRPLPPRLDAELFEKVARAKLQRRRQSSILLPETITELEDLEVVRAPEARPNFVTGRTVRAPVVHLRSGDGAAESFDQDLRGSIVLIERADPGFDWIFARDIAGLVTRFGGANSHMTIRCAEFALPAAIGCGQALFEACAAANHITLDCAQETIHVLG